MEQSLTLINELLDKLFVYGPFWIYVALLVASFIENVFPPFPGDFFTITGGAVAASGRLNIYIVFIMIYIGGICSVMLVYYFGRHFGRDYFMKKNFRLFSADDIVRLEKWFHKRGVWLLIFNRFIVGARSAVTLVTGISRYSSLKTFTSVSVSIWMFNGLLLFASYMFVVNLDKIIEWYHMYERAALTIIILIAVLYIIYRLSRKKKSGR
jgi:membrane protein DedA with SNARE-associated domain